MKPTQPSRDERAADELLVAYLRLLHDYELLRQRYEHARAAIDNDIYLADLTKL
jgi:hypothetical protein